MDLGEISLERKTELLSNLTRKIYFLKRYGKVDLPVKRHYNLKSWQIPKMKKVAKRTTLTFD